VSREAPRVLCVGLSCLDLVWRVEHFPPRESREEASVHERHGGGPAATAAVAASRYGVEAHLWAIHGEDEAGAALLRELEDAGVHTEGIVTPAGARTFTSAVIVDASGERWIFPYRGEGLDDDPARWLLERVAGFDVVLTDLRHPHLAAAVLEKARAAGVPTLVDLGNLRHVELARSADVLIAAEEAAQAALEAGTGEVPEDPTAWAEAAIAALRGFDEQLVAITLGEEGVVYDAGDGLRHLPSLPVDVVDTTGAGDVFHGVWAAALASGERPDACAQQATVGAALACRGPGRTTLASGDEIRRMLQQRSAREMDDRAWA